MIRGTIDFGIDLGTTNSAIAVLRGIVTDVIKNNFENDITASAVHIDKRGSINIGQLAKNQLENEKNANDVHVEFKRKMGTAIDCEFKSAGRTMKPEELSAEILKSLRGDAQQRLGEEIQAAVITIPAAFEHNQCAATKKAAELAGLIQCPLVQEPVAAALAYGFQAAFTKSYWLVYDFGGGTFDAAIMRTEDGTITVVNHGGDNYLGGSDIDWAILEQIVLPELQRTYKLPDFTRGNKKWQSAFAAIKRSVEAAKIQLSRSETAYLEACHFKGASSEEIELDFKLTRGALVNVSEPIIMRSINICKRVLKEKNLSPSAIERVILVGGPTLAPYFREILEVNLGIPLDFSVDPLTVVARGAAVFAGTQRIEGKVLPKAISGQYKIDLKYKPVGADADPSIRGTVKAPTDSNVEGFTIEFINQQSHWRSGKLPLKENGLFQINILAEKGVQNIFAIELLAPSGGKMVTMPDSFHYTIGMAISEQPITNSVSIALANNETEVFFKKGEPLPAKAKKILRSVQFVKKGSADHILNVPVVEGENDLADRNLHLGTLAIKGTDVRRDVPTGSEVEVTLLMDSPGIIRAKAYITMLDEEFEMVINRNDQIPNLLNLQREFNEESERLKTIKDNAINANEDKVVELLEEIEESKGLDDIKHLIDVAKADSVAAKKAIKLLLEIKIKNDKAEYALKWPALIAETNQNLDELDAIIEVHGTEDQKDRANKLREQAEELIQQKRTEPLRHNIKCIRDLHNEVLFEQPEFWMGFFKHLTEQRSKMNDQEVAEQLFNQGLKFIEQGNAKGLRNVVAQLLGLIPQEEAEAIKKGYESGLLK